jgi:hypothetical protein
MQVLKRTRFLYNQGNQLDTSDLGVHDVHGVLLY